MAKTDIIERLNSVALDDVKRPNFFILGAPKCGTTSLASWLAAHPNVYIPEVKEPHYFNDDHQHGDKNAEHYAGLFRECQNRHLAIGDASVWYLYSNTAVPNILEYQPSSRFMVCVRNPLDMAPSLHNQAVVAGVEQIQDFEEAWWAMRDRVNGQRISLFCKEPSFLQYGSACSLGEQLKRLYDIVPRERVLVVVLDDIARDPASQYARVLEFLGVPHDGRTEFSVVNAARERRSHVLRRVEMTASALKRALGVSRRFGVLKTINRLNARPRGRTAMDASMRRLLAEYFRQDVTLLGELLSRDLTSWTSRNE